MPANSRTFPRTTAATKRRSTSSSAGSTARIGAAKRGDPVADPARVASAHAHRARDFSPTNPSTSRTTASRARRRVCTAPSAGQRDQRHPMRGTGVRDDRASSDAQRSVGDADGHIPAVPSQPRTSEVDRFDPATHVRYRWVGPDRHAPRDRVGHAVREQSGEVLSERFRVLSRPPRSRQEDQHQLVAVRQAHCPRRYLSWPACIESGHLPHSGIRRGRGSSIPDGVTIRGAESAACFRLPRPGTRNGALDMPGGGRWAPGRRSR